MGFSAGKFFKGVAFRVDQWGVQEEIEVLGVWDWDGALWCRRTKSFICCGQGRKEGCEDEVKL